MKKIMICILILLTQQASADAYTKWTDVYGQLLKHYVSLGTLNGIRVNLVDYRGIRRDARMMNLRSELAKLPSIEKLSKKKQLAMWINVYNFLTIDTIVRHPGLKKFNDLAKGGKSVWQQPAGRVAGKTMTLDEIENDILRAKFHEPRIHFSLVCAALSCPDLRTEAYTGDKIDSQLQQQLISFLHNNKKGKNVIRSSGQLQLSSLFSWFQGDFNGNPKHWLLSKKMISSREYRYRVHYLNYDWTLNAQPGKN